MNFEQSGTLERRNPMSFGMWAPKHVAVRDRMLAISDREGMPPNTTFELTKIVRVDPLIIQFVGRSEDVQLRAATPEIADEWVERVHDYLECIGVMEQRNAGLPPEDPRNGLKFVDIPPEYLSKFANLDRAVLYWFGGIKKIGGFNVITKRRKIEDRVGFLGDKAFYVTRPNSETTRCIKVEKISALYTNVGVKGIAKDKAASPFLVIKGLPPDYDICFESPMILSLLRCLRCIYRQVTHGKDLRVVGVQDMNDSLVDLKLSRPADFEMTMVVPSTKKQLRRGLEKYYQQRGMRFPTAPRKTIMSAQPEPQDGNNNNSAVETGSGVGARSNNNNNDNNKNSNNNIYNKHESAPMTDPMGCFLTLAGVPQYFLTLYRQNIDLDLLECLDDVDYKNFGVRNPSDATLIQQKLADSAFMESVRERVEEERRSSNWEAKQFTAGGGGEGVSPPSSSNNFNANRGSSAPREIELSDDDDLVVATKSGTQMGVGAIVLSDSDDDLPPPPTSTAKPPIDLDDDDI